MSPVRVLVVDDSLTVRSRVVEMLSSDPRLTVVGVAEDGRSAVALCQRLRPDVITMDMVLPEMSGLAATEQIMAFCPTPILVVSSSSNRGALHQTYDALAAGAVDVLEKPRGDVFDDGWREALCDAVRIVARVKVITHPRARLATLRPPPTVEAAPARPTLVAIGVSTGAPGALRELLGALPPRFSLPILLVVHVEESFGAPLADWLDKQSALRVALARDGDALPHPHDGRVVMAPPGRHLVVQDGRLRLTDAPARHSCRPSVDVLFHSIAAAAGERALAVLLTGMGRDGAEGLLAIRRAGGLTIAQDEASCVVYGMPREAALLGAAERVLPLGDIAEALARADGGRTR